MIKETITEFMKFVDLQPLQYLAAVRVVILVCESEDTQKLIATFSKTIGKDYQWESLRDKVKSKLNQIGVIDLIANIILENLWPIGFQIFRWIVYHAEDTGIDCSSHFCWTPQFKIDYEKTAKILVENEALDIKKRFKLACFYCLDVEVRSLWEQMRLPEKRSFFLRGNLNQSNENPIVLYWAYYIQEVPIEYWDSNALNHAQLFIYAVRKGYLSASKFFLYKLTLNTRKTMISNCLDIHLYKMYNPMCIQKDHLAIACFLFSELPSDYQGFTVFPTLPLVFLYFLEWPMQKHFMTVVNRLGYLIKEKTFGELLVGIFEKDIDFKDHDYKKLFMEFWHQSPEECKVQARMSEVGYRIFMQFAKQHFGIIFEENSLAINERLRYIISQQGVSKNVTHLVKENVKFFKFLVRERFIAKPRMRGFTNSILLNFPFKEYFKLPSGDIKYMIDGILGIM